MLLPFLRSSQANRRYRICRVVSLLLPLPLSHSLLVPPISLSLPLSLSLFPPPLSLSLPPLLSRFSLPQLQVSLTVPTQCILLQLFFFLSANCFGFLTWASCFVAIASAVSSFSKSSSSSSSSSSLSSFSLSSAAGCSPSTAG